LRFYGFKFNEAEDGGISIVRSDAYEKRKSTWITEDNHNFLRITRILTSMRVLGLETYVRALWQCLASVYEHEQNIIGQETYAFWKSAAGE